MEKNSTMTREHRDKILGIVQTLTVTKGNLSATRRRLMSARDDRASAITIGVVGYVLNNYGNSGYFISPNYPSNYPDRQYLTYRAHFSTPGPHTVQVTFDFDLEKNGNSGCYDYVQLLNTGSGQICGRDVITGECYYRSSDHNT
nr:hypothetical protein BaRGS_015482 [Batillaria attramentaria]